MTTRQGGVPMWNGMEDCQKLKLEMLSMKHAMLLLIRWKMARRKTKVEESKILIEVESLCVEDRG